MSTIPDEAMSPQSRKTLSAEVKLSTCRSQRHLLVQLAVVTLLLLLASGQLRLPAPHTASRVVPTFLVDGGGGSSPTPTTNCGGGAGGPC